jgi:hypothetical protein
MIALKNSGLTAWILDPAQDREKLGSRYCAGGYIWQVEDDRLGPLLSGPTYPEKPSGWDGQGLPEVFETALGSDTAEVGEEVCVLGVGKVRRQSPVSPFHVRDNPAVSEFAAWSVESSESVVRMETRQEFRDYAATLVRTVSSQGRVLVSATEISNPGQRPLPVRWFGHPFFPATENLFRLSLACGVPENPGYFLGDDGLLKRKPDFSWEKGWFQPLQLCFGFPIRAEQKHPLLGRIQVICDFPVARLPIWGNDRTSSFEPYFHDVLEPGASARWSMEYRF